MSLLLTLLSTAALAGPYDTCPRYDEALSPTEYLRSLSLSLRGVVPTVEEYDQVVAAGEVPDALIDEWLDSDAFVDRTVRHHRALLWPNVSNQRLVSAAFNLSTRSGLSYRVAQSRLYRGSNGGCGDFPAEFDADGAIVPRVLADGTRQEGWVEVEPYWAPGTTLEVCAYDAQERAVSASGVRCDTSEGARDPACGCGPNLEWCTTYYEDLATTSAMGTDVDLRVARMVRDHEPYPALLTSTKGYVNGPIVDYYRHRTEVPSNLRLDELPVPLDDLPDLAYTDKDTWVEVDLGPQHSGVLTAPGYLLRFQTNRSRANRFYNAFLCQPFQPPEGGIPITNDGHPSLDLTARDGCQYCHALLEPAAAYWGRWTPTGAGYLDPGDFPAFDDECAWCSEAGAGCSAECSLYYVTNPLASEQDPFVGWLKPYEFLEARHASHVEEGPKLLVAETLADGRLPTCVAETTAEWLLGRDVTDEEQPWVDDLVTTFRDSGYEWSALVREIVTSEPYWRVR